MSFPYTTLAYNGITKIVSNELLESLTQPKRVNTIQWYRYQILKMCENMNIQTKDDVKTRITYNNMTLVNRIKNSVLYGTTIVNEDDMKYGLKPCLNHKSVAPIVANKSQLEKSDNNITLKETDYIIWKCGVSNRSLIDIE
jgi:hypothetical protein